MSESYPRAANLLGALALAVSDGIREATEEQADGLAKPEPAALVTLAHYPGQSVGALARTLGLTHSGAVRLADRLVAAGWARRVRAGPGRTLALHLTESGRLGASRVIARRQAFAEELVGGLEPDQVAALEQVAARLLAVLVTDRASAHRLCRLCDEPLCEREARCPVDQAVR